MKRGNDIKDLDEVLATTSFIPNNLQRDAVLVRTSGSIPAPDEVKFYMNNEQLRAKQKAINVKILAQLKKLAAFCQYEDVGRLVDLNHFSHIVGINDQLFENVDMTLDKMKRINQGTESSLLLTQPSLQGQAIDTSATNEALILQATKEKPQNNFSKFLNSNDVYPFIPRLTSKLHAKIPLDEVVMQAQKEGSVEFFKSIQNHKLYEFPHPYAYEIENLTFSEQISEKVTVVEPSDLKEVLVYVDTDDLLEKMITQLSTASEIAIDLEHHSLRTFSGITCLIQISDRCTDFIVDVFAVWGELHKLNAITTNPLITKVLHGADMDVQWLQRDFGVYIVNLFDTGQAARVLSMPNYSLAYLLSSICKTQADKKYQLADWRVRPLGKDLLSYARSDTHYLLKIYDVLRNQLIDKAIKSGSEDSGSLMATVLNKSKVICLRKWIKPVLEDEKYHAILANQRIIMSDRKFRLLKKIMAWRFEQARMFDESPLYVLPNDVMFQIVSRLPLTLKELFANFLKLSYVTQVNAEQIIELVKEEAAVVVTASLEAKEEVAVEIEQEEIIVERSGGRVHEGIEEEDEKEEEVVEQLVFQFETFEIDIEQYTDRMTILDNHYYASESSTMPMDATLERISKSFTYEDPVDFYCEKFPFMREAYRLAKLNEQEVIQKRNQEAALQSQANSNQTNQEGVEAGEQQDDEYLAFRKEKGPSSQPVVQQQIQVQDIPLSYEDQFKTNLKKRKYNFGKEEKPQTEETAVGKKFKSNTQAPVGVKSTFDMLIEQEFRDESGEEEDNQDEFGTITKSKKNKKVINESEKKRLQDDFDSLTDKIKQQMNSEPKYRFGIIKQQAKKTLQHKGAGNKFIKNFKKSGF